MKTKLHGSVIVTYRCNAKCNMCDVWKYPTQKEDELTIETIQKLPDLFFVNVTGGEPFIRDDLEQIIALLRKKARRIVISSNGFFTKRIIRLFEKYPDLGIRISIEGLQKNNDEIRRIPNGFDHTIRTLLTLREMKIRDIGFGITIQNSNASDLIYLYELAKALGYEFATAALHNSHYFKKFDNKINKTEDVVVEFERLIDKLIASRKVKNWFRAYFNFGLINYIRGNPRLLPCEMGQNGFFLDPEGDVLACNGMHVKIPMGNLKEKSWDEIWNSPQAEEVRVSVKNCKKNCWMIGSAAPAIWNHPLKPILWVAEFKTRSVLRRSIKVPIRGFLRNEKLGTKTADFSVESVCGKK